MTLGALSKRRVPDDLFRSWVHPRRHNPKVRRDLNKYLRTFPKRQQLCALGRPMERRHVNSHPVNVVGPGGSRINSADLASREIDALGNSSTGFENLALEFLLGGCSATDIATQPFRLFD